MSFEQAILCGSTSEANLPVGGKLLRLRLWGPRRNVSLGISDITEPMLRNAPDAFVDLVEIATYVYVADQAVTRGGDGVENVGAEWRRRLHFRIPVRSVRLWSSKEVREALVSTLGFLSDDDYSFEFTAFREPPSIQQYLFSPSEAGPEGIEEVALFSGGLDSLGGAVQEAVVDKRRVALVTHEPSRKLARRHLKLKELLTAESRHVPLFIPVRINKKKELGREYTQRTRSFLYASLGATVARMLGLGRIRFYENGVVCFNLPPSAQVVGAKATRTTHPRVLNGFARLFSLIADQRFDVENPFLWDTKAEVVERIMKAGCQETIKFSTSCTHTWEMTKLYPHCGTCSQCIDRRFAVVAAGAEECDPEEAYKVRLFDGERDQGQKRTMIACYVETANEVARMTPVQFYSRFGEASRVLRHLDGSADSVALKIFELHQRHAKRITAAVDKAIADNATLIRQRTLPDTCLLRLVCDSGGSARGGDASASKSEVEQQLSDFVFRKKGQAWQVRYAGGREFILFPTKGAAYLHCLLAQPRTAIAATKLAATVARHPTDYLLGDAGEGSDREALAAYRSRHEDLKAEIDEARSMQNVEAIERIREEMDFLAQQIRHDQGLGGRLRKASDDRDRVRKAVGAAIRRAVDEIKKYDMRLAQHLTAPILSCGLNPCYDPRDPVDWTT